jgi:hypothetical protein
MAFSNRMLLLLDALLAAMLMFYVAAEFAVLMTPILMHNPLVLHLALLSFVLFSGRYVHNKYVRLRLPQKKFIRLRTN